jgi:hypothetical protein
MLLPLEIVSAGKPGTAALGTGKAVEILRVTRGVLAGAELSAGN